MKTFYTFNILYLIATVLTAPPKEIRRAEYLNQQENRTSSITSNVTVSPTETVQDAHKSIGQPTHKKQSENPGSSRSRNNGTPTSTMDPLDSPDFIPPPNSERYNAVIGTHPVDDSGNKGTVTGKKHQGNGRNCTTQKQTSTTQVVRQEPSPNLEPSFTTSNPFFNYWEQLNGTNENETIGLNHIGTSSGVTFPPSGVNHTVTALSYLDDDPNFPNNYIRGNLEANFQTSSTKRISPTPASNHPKSPLGTTTLATSLATPNNLPQAWIENPEVNVPDSRLASVRPSQLPNFPSPTKVINATGGNQPFYEPYQDKFNLSQNPTSLGSNKSHLALFPDVSHTNPIPPGNDQENRNTFQPPQQSNIHISQPSGQNEKSPPIFRMETSSINPQLGIGTPQGSPGGFNPPFGPTGQVLNVGQNTTEKPWFKQLDTETHHQLTPEERASFSHILYKQVKLWLSFFLELAKILYHPFAGVISRS